MASGEHPTGDPGPEQFLEQHLDAGAQHGVVFYLYLYPPNIPGDHRYRDHPGHDRADRTGRLLAERATASPRDRVEVYQRKGHADLQGRDGIHQGSAGAQGAVAGG